MAERDVIVAELKRALRERGLTYTDVAEKLGLHVASVKRLLTSGDLTLERVEKICELLQTGLADIVARTQERPVVSQLTVEQEQEIVSDPKLFLVCWLLVNRISFEEIVRNYQFTEREVLRLLIRLDQLKCIELQPGNRVRLLVNRHFSWRPGGPMQQFVYQKLLREFMTSNFVGPQEEFLFHGGEVSEAGMQELKQVFRNASRQCAEILERDRGPRDSRHSTAFLLALRPWKYSGFAQFERE
jgi:DNA-binding Xre family transcriptional regulator